MVATRRRATSSSRRPEARAELAAARPPASADRPGRPRSARRPRPGRRDRRRLARPAAPRCSSTTALPEPGPGDSLQAVRRHHARRPAWRSGRAPISPPMSISPAFAGRRARPAPPTLRAGAAGRFLARLGIEPRPAERCRRAPPGAARRAIDAARQRLLDPREWALCSRRWRSLARGCRRHRRFRPTHRIMIARMLSSTETAPHPPRLLQPATAASATASTPRSTAASAPATIPDRVGANRARSPPRELGVSRRDRWSLPTRPTAPRRSRSSGLGARTKRRGRRHGHRRGRGSRSASSPPIARRCCSPIPRRG